MRAFNKFLTATIIALTLSQPAFALESITILADSSLSIAMAKIARNYARVTGVSVNTSFAPQKIQQTQITEGGAGDILITPMQPWIDQLKTQGVVDIYSQTLLARNRLALVAPANSPLSINLAERFPLAQLINQLGFEPGFVIGNPETLQEGVYGKEALRNMGVASDLEQYTLYIKQLDQMFDAVANQRDYGIFFYSTTIGRQGVRVLDLFPEDTHHPIQYYAVVIAGENMDAARRFLGYLKTPQARRIFENSGFSID